jgi:hypothetical protein
MNVITFNVFVRQKDKQWKENDYLQTDVGIKE